MIEGPRRWRYVVQDRDRHGNLRTYLRVPGRPKVRLHETPGTDAFEAEYRAALSAEPKAKAAPKGTVLPGSIDALCVAYYRSAEFRKMDPRTQRVRRLILDRFRAATDSKGRVIGTKPAALIGPHHLLRIRDARADTPEAANSLLKALRAVFKHGMAVRLVPGNPALAVSYLAANNPDGIHAWTMEEVEQYERKHPVGTKARLALALLLYTAQRRSDIVQFGRQHVRDGWLTFTQQKNRRRKPVRLSIPIVPELQRILDATPSGGLTFLTTEHGGAYTADSFGNRFRAWCREAGLPHCSAHGLRKAAATRLAEMGCTPHEIMAVTGHRTLKEVDRYTREAAQRLLAASAFDRLRAKEVSHPGAATPEWDENSVQPTEKKGNQKCMVPRGGIEPPTLRFSVACSTN